MKQEMSPSKVSSAPAVIAAKTNSSSSTSSSFSYNQINERRSRSLTNQPRYWTKTRQRQHWHKDKDSQALTSESHSGTKTKTKDLHLLHWWLELCQAHLPTSCFSWLWPYLELSSGSPFTTRRGPRQTQLIGKYSKLWSRKQWFCVYSRLPQYTEKYFQ